MLVIYPLFVVTEAVVLLQVPLATIFPGATSDQNSLISESNVPANFLAGQPRESTPDSLSDDSNDEESVDLNM